MKNYPLKNLPILLFLFLLFLFLILGCASEPLADTTTSGEETSVATDLPPGDAPAAGENPGDLAPYKLVNGTFLGLQAGAPLASHKAGLRDGKLRTGEGTFDVFFIDSAEGDELGYVLPDPRDPGAIRSITITSPNVVTEKGVRTGIEFPELMQRLGVVSISGSEIEGRVYAKSGNLLYRLGMTSTSPNIKSSEVPAGTKVTEIVLGQ